MRRLAAADYADPVATKLVTYYRLLAPGAATADEITDFMAQNPDWPNQALLERRRQEAIAAEPDHASTLAQCDRDQLTLAAGDAALRRGEANAGRNAEAADEARRAWIDGITDAGAETAFLRRWSGAIRPEDQWARFQRLAWHDASRGGAADRRGSIPPHRAAAEARLALQHDAPNAEALLAALPAALRHDPGMMLDRARWLRQADRTADALALWQRDGEAAQARCADGRSSPRSGPSATCSPAACCATAMPPAPMRWPRTTARSRRSRCWTRSSSPASSRCAG